MKFAVLASGSKANSTYLEIGGAAVLIDCGLSAKETKRRLTEVGVAPEKIQAIFVTHEHSDHIRGLSVLSRQLKIPIFANSATAKSFNNIFAWEKFVTGEEFIFNDLTINPFSIVHDASDPVGFSISSGASKFVQLTDLGRVTNLVRSSIMNCNALVLESNYDQQKLYDCEYPWELKQRISSTHGHLSNNDAASLLADVNHTALRHVVLGHLSENSNEPELALKAASEFVEFNDFDSIECGSVYQSTRLISL